MQLNNVFDANDTTFPGPSARFLMDPAGKLQAIFKKSLNSND